MEHCELGTLAANALNGNAVAGQAFYLLCTWTAALYDGADESSIVRWRRHLGAKALFRKVCLPGIMQIRISTHAVAFNLAPGAECLFNIITDSLKFR